VEQELLLSYGALKITPFFSGIRVAIINRKSMKIPKGKSEDLIPRMTDNTIMAKRKRTKEQTTKHYTEN
jgi:hypothetical protein